MYCRVPRYKFHSGIGADRKPIFSPWPGRAARLTAIIGLLCGPALIHAQEQRAPQEYETRERRFVTREEQRDEAPKHEIFSWLTASGLVELEYLRRQFALAEFLPHSYERESGRSFEAVLDITPLPWLRAELVWEYDARSNRDKLDEAIIALEFSDFELELGRLYPPFGEFYSHFISGPLLEFGETRGTGAVLSYAPTDWLDISTVVFRGKAEKLGSNGSAADWGLAVEVQPLESTTLGMSYFSDLAESDENLLADTGRRYQRRVDGINAYALAVYEWGDVTAEWVRALDAFRELETDRNQPEAWNLEVAVYVSDDLTSALRVEGSSELEDAPRTQGGVALTWRLWSRVFVTFELLRGKFKPGLAEDEKERELRRVNQIGTQISIDL